MLNKALRFLQYLWTVPHTLVGVLLMVYYRPRFIRWHDGCIEAIPRTTLIGGTWVGAQTYGWLIYYKNEEQLSRAVLRVHERVHVKQSFTFGPLFPILYIGHWLWLWQFGFKNTWIGAYYEIWAERAAYGKQFHYLQSDDKQSFWGHIQEERR